MSQEKKASTACAIIIGNEILSGRTQDANLPFIGQRCDELGIRLTESRIIPDDEATIIAAVNECRRNFTYVFTTGGIGPTHDDITALSVAHAFDRGLERNQEAIAALDRYYPPEKLTEARLKMADIPVGATLIDNPVSGAPGFQLENVFVFAGVPSIMREMFNGITDRLAGGEPVLTGNVTTDLTEGVLAEGLGRLQEKYADVSIGSYPFFRQGKLGVNIVSRGTNKQHLQALIQELKELINTLDGNVILVEGDD